MLLTSLPVTPSLTPPHGHQTAAGGLAQLSLSKALGCSIPRVRFRIPSSSSGTSPASPASSASAPAKDADDASDAGDGAHAGEGTSGNEGGKGGKGSQQGKAGKDLREERDKIWGKNSLGGKDLWEEKRNLSPAKQGLAKQWGDRISNGKGGKRLWEEKGGDLGGKRP